MRLYLIKIPVNTTGQFVFTIKFWVLRAVNCVFLSVSTYECKKSLLVGRLRANGH